MNTIQDKRARILAAGTSVMLRKGYNGTGVQEITQGAGVPKGSFYHYFESKEDFAIQALHYYYTPRIERFAAALSAPELSPRERILRCYRDLIGYFANQEQPSHQCFIGSLCHEKADESQPIGYAAAAILQRSSQVLAECLEQARTVGEISPDQDPAALASFIGAAWEGALLRMKTDRQIAPLRVFIDQLERLLSA
ncbi:TetR/AcrR family transcriptional regulator [Halopseudomonas sabulinigri]|uniref:TetR/AcrR family transcriptional regulator n=1 Tax=Halopseudomonas sabulinigri TaxID=472181 RepID=A0A1H1RDN4_9GAMM|nr:TetR/AcrR family transcriptional regulator [Halopseudomonas sabulinigri]SDS33864.1 TetR/AcrR family transcriptional regulator, transcriptional repressor for nem operon [Halopseudomonas sabulinigri]